MNPNLIQKLTPEAAERLLMLEHLTSQRALEPKQPEAKPVSEWPQLGRSVFVKKDYNGIKVEKNLVFFGVTSLYKDSTWSICGMFFDKNSGTYHNATLENLNS
jgi:hypothetical protein